jgi:hypothetical protein
VRWLGLFRRRREDLVAATAASERPKLWAEIALPPPLETATLSPSEEPVVEALEPALAGTRSTVRLGFADGTSVEVDSESAESAAFRATATRLLEASAPLDR